MTDLNRFSAVVVFIFAPLSLIFFRSLVRSPFAHFSLALPLIFSLMFSLTFSLTFPLMFSLSNLVIKNFMFEFVNNYFVMFYIAYLRHIEFPVGVPQKCDKSCLSELQIKLFIVFTGKTL